MEAVWEAAIPTSANGPKFTEVADSPAALQIQHRHLCMNGADEYQPSMHASTHAFWDANQNVQPAGETVDHGGEQSSCNCA